MREVIVLKDPKVVKEVLNEIRYTILFDLLSKQPMTVKQIADALGKTPGSIMHHVNKLLDLGLISIVSTNVSRTGIVEKYYRANARKFYFDIDNMFSSLSDISQFAEAHLKTVLSIMEKYGMKIKKSKIDEAIEIIRKIRKVRLNEIEKIPQFDDSENEEIPENSRMDAFELTLLARLHTNPEYNKLLDNFIECFEEA